MENLTNTAVHLLEDSQGADLTRREKRKLSVEITTAMIALVCLVTGLLYKGIFPEQTAVAGADLFCGRGWWRACPCWRPPSGAFSSGT